MKFVGFAAILLALAGCASNSNPPLIGIWRSTLAELTLTDQGGTVVFACATGIISQPARPDSDGSFSVLGSYTQLSGAQPPTPPRPEFITYLGKGKGSKLTFEGRLQSGAKIGPIEVIKDSTQQVLICP